MAGLLEIDQAVIEGDRSGTNDTFEHSVKVAAVDVEIRAAIALLALGVEHDLVHRLAGVPSAADVAMRFDAGLDERLFDAKAAQNLHYVCAEDDPRSNSREGGRLIIDL